MIQFTSTCSICAPHSRSCQRDGQDTGFPISAARKRHPGRIDETSVDQLAEATLRLLGVPAPEATRIAALPLPPATTW
jgi:hypothetical protein